MSQALQKQDNRPSWLASFEEEGIEDVSSKNKQIYLKVIQQQSEEFAQGLAKIGDLINSVTKEVYQRPLTVTLIKIHDIWKKFNSKLVFEAYSTDGITWSDGTRLTADESWKNKVTDFYVIPDGSQDLMILSIKGTSTTAAKEWRKMVEAAIKINRFPIFYNKYTITTEIVSTPKIHAVVHISKSDQVNTEEICKLSLELRKGLEDYLKQPVLISPPTEYVDVESSEPLDID